MAGFASRRPPQRLGRHGLGSRHSKGRKIPFYQSQENLLQIQSRDVNTRFRESIDKDLAVITDPGLLRRIRRIIEQVEPVRTFQEIPNLKRLEAKGKCVSIRASDYRVGLLFEQGVLTFVRCLYGREIYCHFP